MELWIRSQNKDYLIKATDLYIPISRTNEDFSIYTICTDFRLGTYKTRQRALEVLDEIQTQIATLNYQYLHRGTNFIATESNVYEMPKE